MKRVGLFLLILIFSIKGLGQESLHNFGNLKVHDTGALGFHFNLINDGFTDDNDGLVGFFHETESSISGAFQPIFNDVEVMVGTNLFLDVGISIKRHFNFIDGTIITPRGLTDVNTNFTTSAFYSGEKNNAKVNGYAMMTTKDRFRFPIGDTDRIRPLYLETEQDSISAKCAYFLENPNNPSSFGESFDTKNLGEGVLVVSQTEFWHLDGTSLGRVELLWDDRSDIISFVESVEI